MAAEIEGGDPQPVDLSAGFNEAAANGRGNRGRDARRHRPADGFNEAAANGRGNRTPAGIRSFSSSALQ